MLKRVVIIAAVAVVGTACGGGGESATDTEHPSAGKPSCSASGTSLSLTAKNVAFDASCLAAPADTAFTIEFDNQDAGTMHNISIESSSGEELFEGEVVTGPTTTTYEVDALAAGTYEFHCDVHPTQMKGTFVVGGP